jgi:hypothetical protein
VDREMEVCFSLLLKSTAESVTNLTNSNS